MTSKESLLHLTVDIVTAHVANNTVSTTDVPAVIEQVHRALDSLSATAVPLKQKPAVTIKASIRPEYLVCLEDGKRVMLLKSYLREKHGLTPEQYRTKWGLPENYPMVAPNYSARRRECAIASGFGRKAEPGKAPRRAN